MATFQSRIAEFNQGDPPLDQLLVVLCRDHNGTYELPFDCRWVGQRWVNARSGDIIDAEVIGWVAARKVST